MKPLVINDKIYGQFKITEPVLIELIKSRLVQRLKKINQHGTQGISQPEIKVVNRFEHSVGVMLLLRKFNASLEEQIAGLLHDISHTAFSHVIDAALGNSRVDNYHESYVRYILENSEIPKILKKYNFSVTDITNEKNFPLLDLPELNLCADRLDYFLRDSYICYNFLNKKQTNKILNGLKVINNKWVFANKSTAKFMAEKFIYTAEYGWYQPQNQMGFIILGQIIKEVMKKGLIKKKDLFTDDKTFIKKLSSLKNPEVKKGLKLLKNFKAITDYNDYDYLGRWKFRAVDPYILKGNDLIHLSQLDQNFKKYLINFKNKIKKGIPIRILKG